MSTKIYYAYRVKKSIDILDKLFELKTYTNELISKNTNLLKSIHIGSILTAYEEYEKYPENSKAKYAVEDDQNGKIDEFYIKDFLKKQSSSTHKSYFDIIINCSIFYDDNYWYIKFFPNAKLHEDVIDYAEKQLGFEDYHYQNQCDPPEDISEEEYEERNTKWVELTKRGNGNYRHAFNYELYNEEEFYNLLTKNYYTGNPLFDHLSYKFDINVGEIFLRNKREKKLNRII